MRSLLFSTFATKHLPYVVRIAVMSVLLFPAVVLLDRSKRVGARRQAESCERYFMGIAVEQALKATAGAGAAPASVPSQSTGCVIVKGNKVISTGYSGELFGGANAEECALRKLGSYSDAEGADVYTTMEPCGSNLPATSAEATTCIDRLIEAQVGRVIVGAVPAVVELSQVGGLFRLKDAGVRVLVLEGMGTQCAAPRPRARWHPSASEL
jgi:pyrimidine deaminase RibD-like protein